jgi:hypothetical protein
LDKILSGFGKANGNNRHFILCIRWATLTDPLTSFTNHRENWVLFNSQMRYSETNSLLKHFAWISVTEWSSSTSFCVIHRYISPLHVSRFFSDQWFSPVQSRSGEKNWNHWQDGYLWYNNPSLKLTLIRI